MVQALGSAIVVLLVIIAVELLLIHRDILLLTAFRRGVESEGAGQTINVNVGPKDERTASLPEREAPPAVEPARETPAEEVREPRAAEAAEVEREAAEIESALVAMRATSSGLIAKRCAACGMENSSMRNECFNCGASI